MFKVIDMDIIKESYKKEFDLYDEIFKIQYQANGIPFSKVTHHIKN